SAVSSIVSGRSYSDRRALVLRPVQMTVAPASPSAAAMPRPAPRVAPATTATRPRSASLCGVHPITGVISVTERGRTGTCGGMANLFTALEARDVVALRMTGPPHAFQYGVVVIGDTPVREVMTVPVTVDDDVGGTQI